MTVQKCLKLTILTALCAMISACGANRGPDGKIQTVVHEEVNDDLTRAKSEKSSIWDLLQPADKERTVQVNRYLWSASLEILNFLPIQSVDPFTGVIVTGYGTPPGGGRSYRATVHIKDPALEARSLNIALHTKGGPAATSTTRAVEDAILSRARQLRIADRNL